MRSEPKGEVPATFAQRAMALLIDFALLTLGHAALFVLVVVGLNSRAVYDPLGSYLALFLCGVVFLLGYPVLHAAYFTLLHAWGGQTLGKLAMGIGVVREDRALTLGPAFLRWAGYLFSFIPLGAGFLWAVLDRAGCTWHDRLALTRVCILPAGRES